MKRSDGTLVTVDVSYGSSYPLGLRSVQPRRVALVDLY